MRKYPQIGIQVSDILLPKSDIDLHKWSVIACDQFTSEPEYWEKAKDTIGDSPSTLNLLLPEVFLETPEEPALIQKAQETMKEYLENDYFETYEGLILVSRTVNGKTRHGLMLSLDLENYDYNKGSQTLIRATEGTILERLPPRMKIREDALLELPHILVLIDDPEQTVIEPIIAQKSKLQEVYNFELMQGSGQLQGYFVNDQNLEQQVVKSLEKLADESTFKNKYDIDNDSLGVLLFAMGDGNHSLATAKAIWEKIKDKVGMDHPARYALVEIENIHDEGLEFEPIHRILFNTKEDTQAALKKYFGDTYSFEPCKNEKEINAIIANQKPGNQAFGMISDQGCGVVYIKNPSSNLPVGTLQTFLDEWQQQKGFEKIDYVHGERVVFELGAQPGNAGFLLPAMDKSDLFKTVILDGSLPRKTFSMGEAEEKRFYLECKRIA